MAPRRRTSPWAFQAPTSMEPDIADGFTPQMPTYAPPMASPAFAPPEAQGDPYEAQILAQLAGLQAPTMDSSPEPEFNPGGFGGFLEGMAGLENQRGPARTFGEGLIGGFSRGLGTAGTRVASQRQKFEESATQRQAVRDQQHQQATRDYKAERQRLFGDLGKVRGDERRAKKAEADAAAKEAAKPRLTQEMIDAAPMGSPIKRLRVGTLLDDASTMATLTAPPAPKAPRVVGPLELITGPDGKPVYATRADALGKAPAPKEAAAKPSTGEQKTALGYYNRAQQAGSLLERTDKTGKTLEARINSVPIPAATFGQAVPGFLNVLKGPDRIEFEQARKQFAQAILRKESGAAISASEYAGIDEIFFPVPGDPPQVLENKRQARNSALEGLAFQSGTAYDEYYGTPAPRASQSQNPADARTAAVQPGNVPLNGRPPLSSFDRP